MSERAVTRELAGARALTLRIRSLTYPDLPQVIAIERRVFPTPWSLAMFVLDCPTVGYMPGRDRHAGRRRGAAGRLSDLLAL